MPIYVLCPKDGKVDQKAFDYLRKTYPLRREWAAHWRPSSMSQMTVINRVVISMHMRARATMYAQIRQFFAERDVLEVETPVLSQAGVTHVDLASVQAQRHVYGQSAYALFANFT